MSVRTLSRVWDDSQHSGTELLMLLAIADFADDDGRAYPSVAKLAKKCRTTPRHANRLLAALRDSGELEIRLNAGEFGQNRYRILFSAIDKAKPTPDASVTPDRRVTPDESVTLTEASATPDGEVPKPLTSTSAKPSLNRQEPSSKARRVRTASTKASDFMLPDWIPVSTWADFVAMRKSIRKAMTPAAMRLQVGVLEKLRSEGHEPRAVLEQSIAASWQGLFPIKADTRSGRVPVLGSDDVFEGAR